MIDYFFLLVILGAASYRIARFVTMDSLWEATRARLYGRLEDHVYVTDDDGLATGEQRVWPAKVRELLGCPYCITVWTAALLVGGWWAWYGIQAPLVAWLAVSTTSLGWWAIGEGYE